MHSLLFQLELFIEDGQGDPAVGVEIPKGMVKVKKEMTVIHAAKYDVADIGEKYIYFV
jgi:hypothetical protein